MYVYKTPIRVDKQLPDHAFVNNFKRLYIQPIARYISKLIILDCCSWMLTSLTQTTLFSPRPKMPLMLRIFVAKFCWQNGILSLGRNTPKINLKSRALAFYWQTVYSIQIIRTCAVKSGLVFETAGDSCALHFSIYVVQIDCGIFL